MIRKLTPEDFPRTDELFAIAFEQSMERRPADPGDTDTRWAAFDDATGKMMSMLVVNDYQVHFDGSACKMAGIGGVATLPQYRRRGGIRGCFEAMLPDLYANGYDFSYLYPFSTAYYRKFGYECCVQKYQASVDLALLRPENTAGTLHLVESGDPMTEDVRAVDSLWENRYNMMVRHSPEDYRWLEKLDPAVKQEFAYVYRAADGTPKAYTVFTAPNQPDGRNLICSKLFFTDREGFQGLMGLFKSMASDHRFVKFTLPASVGMQYLFPERSLGAVTWSIHTAGMVRVVNVKSVLEKACYSGAGTARLQILDPQIPENNQTFEASFTGGKAESVEPTHLPPTVTLTIPAFSALISGVCDFAEASDWMPGITVHQDAAALPNIFCRKPLLIADYF